MENELDERFITWIASVYPQLNDMPKAQRRQIELAFYAGAIAASTVPQTVVLEAVQNHMRRIAE